MTTVSATPAAETPVDPELDFRALSPRADLVVGALLLALSAFHYYTAGFGLLRETTHRGIHLAFVLGLVFLVFPAFASGKARVRAAGPLAPLGIPLLDWALAAGAVVGALYLPYIFEDLVFRLGNPGTVDVLMGTILIVVMLEATRRAVGPALPVIAVCLMLYALYGRSLPGVLVHAGNSWPQVVNHLYFTSQGIYGVALGVVATYVFHYVLFGVLATRTGLGKLFIDLASAVAGRYSGGPAKVSILGSALFGTISGSSIANTVTVGSLTIPAMIRLGYQRHFAAAVESTASTGGQITPPIMGAAAFLMVEFLNVSYRTVILAAVVPAFMHFFGVFAQVHFEAKKNGLRGMTKEELPDVRETLRANWPSATPLIALLVVLFSGYTPYLAAFWGITGCLLWGLTRDARLALALLAAVIVGAFTGLLASGPVTIGLVGAVALASAYAVSRAEGGRARAADMIDAFVLGAKYAISVGTAAATVGIIVGVVTLTGVGFKLSGIVTGAAASMAEAITPLLPFATLTGLTLLFTLMMTAIVCVLLGCGVPTTANYIIMVTVAAPALVLLGTEPIVAHFAVFYYGVLADVTPPVALAAYAGASIAGADPFKTGNTAFRLALGKALVPFAFLFAPSMLLVTRGFTWTEFSLGTGSTILGVLALSAAFTGFARAPLAAWERGLLAAAGLILIAPGWGALALGLAVAAPVVARQAMATPRPVLAG